MKHNTSLIDIVKIKREKTNKEIINQVYEALKEKGYNPEAQISGYLLTGDPTYITNHKRARALINNIAREDLIAELLELYLKDDE